MSKEYRKINTLKNWDKNPRSIKEKDFTRLKKMLEKLGEFKPLIIIEDGTVLGGNMRLRAYKELGWDQAWVSVVEADTEEEKLSYALADNERAGFYDEDLLGNLTGEFPEFEWGDYAVDLKPPTTLDDLFPSEVEEDEVPAVSDEPAISKLGEVYQLGRHRLMCGDATKREDVDKLMDGKKADMVFTDPPYSVNYEKKNKEVLKSASYTKITNDELSTEEISQKIWKPSFDLMAEVSKDGASIYVTMPQGGDQMMIMMMMMMNAWQIKHELIWVKSSPVFSMGRLDYDYMHEPIAYGWKKSHTFYGGGQHKKSIWTIERDGNKSHPTMKPVALMVNAIKNSSKEEDIIIDIFGGSGSTLIACEQTNRTCYMAEIDPKYVDVIRKRYAKFINKEDEWEIATPLISR